MRFCILAVSQILQEKSFDKVLIFDYSRARRRRGFEPSGRKKAARKPERLVCDFAPFAEAPFLQNGAFRRARTACGPRFIPPRTRRAHRPEGPHGRTPARGTRNETTQRRDLREDFRTGFPEALGRFGRMSAVRRRGPTDFRDPEKVFARRFLFGRNQEDMRSRHSVECRTVRSSALGAQAVRRALMRAETLPRSARPFTRGFTRAMTLPMAAMPVRPTAAVASSMIAAISSSVSA